MNHLVDTDYPINAAGGDAGANRTLDGLSIQGLAVSIVSVGEFYEGAFGFPDPAAVLVEARAFLRPYVVLPLTDSAVERFARVRAALRRQGRLIRDMDVLIAATALDADLILVTRNVRHFERVPGLTLYQTT